MRHRNQPTNQRCKSRKSPNFQRSGRSDVLKTGANGYRSRSPRERIGELIEDLTGFRQGQPRSAGMPVQQACPFSRYARSAGMMATFGTFFRLLRPSRRQISIADREPFGVAFTILVTVVALVQQVPQFVNQDIVQVKILNCPLVPNQFPRTGIASLPPSTVHFRFHQHRWLRRSVEDLDERVDRHAGRVADPAGGAGLRRGAGRHRAAQSRLCRRVPRGNDQQDPDRPDPAHLAAMSPTRRSRLLAAMHDRVGAPTGGRSLDQPRRHMC